MKTYCEKGLCGNCAKLEKCEYVREGKLFCDNFVKSKDDD